INPSMGSILISIVKCEQSYTSFEYLKMKFFRRDHNKMYADINNSIRNFIKSPPDQPDVDRLVKICQNLKNFLRIRQEQIIIYREIPIYFQNVMSENFTDKIEACKEKVGEFKITECMGSLGVGVEKELTILKYLFMGRKAIIEYNLEASVIFLYKVKSLISSWKEICSQQIYSEQKSEETGSTLQAIQAFFIAPDRHVKRGHNSPNHILWLEKFLNNLISKMSLYFMRIFLGRETAMGADVRSLLRRINPDYHSAIRNFRNRHISLVYEITDEPFHENGYNLAGEGSFRFIYSCEDKIPMDHLPKIISIIQENNEKKGASLDKSEPVCVKDQNACYYFIHVEHHVYLVAISERTEKVDSSTMEFITTLARRLDGTE
ncbi:4109_t:CDS:2, partial [Acaulospora morrowiae]